LRLRGDAPLFAHPGKFTSIAAQTAYRLKRQSPWDHSLENVDRAPILRFPKEPPHHHVSSAKILNGKHIARPCAEDRYTNFFKIHSFTNVIEVDFFTPITFSILAGRL